MLLGFCIGLGYTLLDSYLDHTFGVQAVPPARPVEVLHALIDFVLPPITGALLGVAVHYVRLRAKMAELEKQRADGLVGDLHKIERDQAVWVISASLLHELKNPLHSLGLLLDEVLELPESERREQQALLMRARAQLERIATELATLRALPSNAQTHVPLIELQPLVKQATQQTRRNRATLTVAEHLQAPGVRVRANPAYVRIIVENLLENASDALVSAPSIEVPRIDVSVYEDEHCACVEVRDNGPGLDAETRERLFEPLNTTKPHGLGLGLAIARTLARSMGGDLVLLEQPTGCLFRLTLGRERGAA